MVTAMSDRTISRSSSSTSPTSRTAARSRRVGARFAGPAAFAALLLGSVPTAATEPCAPLEAHSLLETPAAGDVFVRAGAAACDRIAIEVVGRGLEQAFTLSFDVRFP